MKSIVNRSVWSVMVRRGANVGREVLCTTLSAVHVLQMESKVSILVKRGIAVTKDKNNIGKTTSPTMLKQETSVFRKHADAVHDGCQEGVEFEMRVTHIFKNDPTGRQVMEGVGLRELVADHILNSRDEFHQPGELIPVLEGARRNNRRSNNIVNNNNSNNSDNIDNSDNSQVVSQTNGNLRKVTTAVVVAGSTGGVTTRARARRENLVV